MVARQLLSHPKSSPSPTSPSEIKLFLAIAITLLFLPPPPPPFLSHVLLFFSSSPFQRLTYLSQLLIKYPLGYLILQLEFPMYTTLSSVFPISKHAQVSLFSLPKFTKDKSVIYLLSLWLPYVLKLLLPLEMPKELTIPVRCIWHALDSPDHPAH